MKILSIDWDYFIDASMSDRASMFPDGGNENLPPYIRDILWVSHYDGNLEKVNIKQKDFEILKDLIANKFSKIMIADSHKHIYDFIEQNYDDDMIEVTNIDFHHDLYGINNIERTEVDCGNWMVKLVDEYDCTYKWIKQNDSDDNLENKNFCKIDNGEIEELTQEDFDLLYICRSSMWSPPHLDKYFIDAFIPLIKQKEIEVIYEDLVFNDRYNKEFLKMVNENKEMIKNMKNKGRDEIEF